MILYIIFGIAVLVLLYVLVTYNQLIKHNNAVREAFSTMDVYMKKRWDLIPNIVATVKAHAAYEKDVLEKIAALRSGTYESLSQNDKLLINDRLSENIPSLMLVAEGYPVLKSDQSFLELSRQLSRAEEDIANSRKYFNAVVEIYNNAIEMFPGNLVSRLLGYKTLRMFEVQGSEKENVRVD